MKKICYHAPYCKLYKSILQETVSITFEELLALRALKILDSRRVHFIVPDNKYNFGHFEIELDTPTYRYNHFFDASHAKEEA